MKKGNLKLVSVKVLSSVFGFALIAGVMFFSLNSNAQFQSVTQEFSAGGDKKKCYHKSRASQGTTTNLCKGTVCESSQDVSGSNYAECG